MSFSLAIKKPKKTARTKTKPTLLLIGSFSDHLLEALATLKYDFSVNKSSKPHSSKSIDILIFDTDHSSQALEYIKKYKGIPILHATNSLFADYNSIKETGNAFLYIQSTPWHLLEAIVRATETYKFTYDWTNLKAEIQDLAKHL